MVGGQINRVTNTPFGKIQNTTMCPTCNGEGSVIIKPCKKCNGIRCKIKRRNYRF